GLRGRRLRGRDAGPRAADRIGRPSRQGRIRAERRRAGGPGRRVRRQELPRDGEVLRRGARSGLLVPALALLFCAAAAPAPAPPAPAPAAPAQDDDRPLDARTFAQGMDAVRQGKRDDAIRILRKLGQDFPDSPFAPQALLKAAELIYPVAAWDQ